jgi:hypothetical protein
LIYNSSASNVFAVTNQANAVFAKCTNAGMSDGSGSVPAGRQLVKCCWEALDENLKSQTYCSTCEDGGTRGKINCTEPQQTFTSPTSGGLVEDGVLEQPPTGDESSSPKNGEALDESQQNPSFNGENQEGQSSISKEALSNLDNPDMSFEVQEENDTNNPNN